MIELMKFYKILLPIILLVTSAMADHAGAIDATQLSAMWGIPFAGLLLSIAVLPLVAAKFWHQHYGKVAAAWGSIVIAMIYNKFGIAIVLQDTLNTLFHHYIPFLCLIGALFTLGGGIHIKLHGETTPALNSALLGIGTLLASAIGTTGAAMLLIRPLIELNKHRKSSAHVVIFFIFLVANIGGCLTPLGDPPLFLGFLNGIEFTWPLFNLYKPLATIALPLLLIFWAFDHYMFYRHKDLRRWEPEDDISKLLVQGKRNMAIMPCVIGIIIISGIWDGTGPIELIHGVSIEMSDLVRDLSLICLAMLSRLITPKKIYKYNNFSWEPFLEVVKLFAGIFIAMIPVTAMLEAGESGAFAPMVALANTDGIPNENIYFWLTGLLSAFLDNAPAYLVFFHMAGGDPNVLMSSLNPVLVGISSAAVFMGAMTYIGNAPNFMVKAIAEHQQVKMPSFVGYMLWSCALLLPLFLLMNYLWL